MFSAEQVWNRADKPNLAIISADNDSRVSVLPDANILSITACPWICALAKTWQNCRHQTFPRLPEILIVVALNWNILLAVGAMKPPKSQTNPEKSTQILEKLRRAAEIRSKGYRERALALFPHVCASCSREFSGKRLKELTVHHKDGRHDNNPNDGSNWELLCIYCHDHEHEKYKLAGQVALATTETPAPAKMADPFAKLDDLLKSKPKG